MNTTDWIVLFGTLFAIVFYGIQKTKKQVHVDGYLRGNSTNNWWIIGLSIMGTQASAVTFLSTTGQGMEDGMRFAQFYFGLPLAMVIVAYKIAPLYFRLKVYTAYEYLETRFDAKTRALGAILFLCIRGMSAGITLFAPSLVLSTILGWPIFLTTVFIGCMVLAYTLLGGYLVVTKTQSLQLTIVMGGMLAAGIIAWQSLPLTLGETFDVARQEGKLQMITTNFSWSDRYNIWSGLLASTLLFLSYFGTDQSQVSRYLGGRSEEEIRIGLLMNGLLKIPMQCIILFIGVLVFLFYQFNPQPAFHNERALLKAGEKNDIQLNNLLKEHQAVENKKQIALEQWLQDWRVNKRDNKRAEILNEEKRIQQDIRKRMGELEAGSDHDYIFLNFVLHHLPHGMIGLLIAVIFLAAMSSLSAEWNSLAGTTCIDIYKRWMVRNAPPLHYVQSTKWFTVLWAVMTLFFAHVAGQQSENLIQFVNIVGSLFYGTILGIFLAAFYFKRISSNAVFVGAIIAEAVVLAFYFFYKQEIAFLYYNIIGCVTVLVIALLYKYVVFKKQ